MLAAVIHSCLLSVIVTISERFFECGSLHKTWTVEQKLMCALNHHWFRNFEDILNETLNCSALRRIPIFRIKFKKTYSEAAPLCHSTCFPTRLLEPYSSEGMNPTHHTRKVSPSRYAGKENAAKSEAEHNWARHRKWIKSWARELSRQS